MKLFAGKAHVSNFADGPLVSKYNDFKLSNEAFPESIHVLTHTT